MSLIKIKYDISKPYIAVELHSYNSLFKHYNRERTIEGMLTSATASHALIRSHTNAYLMS